jgi:hypothetical protein
MITPLTIDHMDAMADGIISGDPVPVAGLTPTHLGIVAAPNGGGLVTVLIAEDADGNRKVALADFDAAGETIQLIG